MENRKKVLSCLQAKFGPSSTFVLKSIFIDNMNVVADIENKLSLKLRQVF